jgi:hypothetical protein
MFRVRRIVPLEVSVILPAHGLLSMVCNAIRLGR